MWELRNFREAEFRYPDKMDPVFLHQLDEFRSLIDAQFIVTEDFAVNGHANASLHYRGRAVDGHFEKNGKRLSAIEQLFLALKSPFNGIGIYTWSENGAFLHLDNRSTFDRHIWTCEHKDVYKPLNLDFIKKIIV
jgi:uncharacterized protein YcbK (DUF882 family)